MAEWENIKKLEDIKTICRARQLLERGCRGCSVDKQRCEQIKYENNGKKPCEI